MSSNTATTAARITEEYAMSITNRGIKVSITAYPSENGFCQLSFEISTLACGAEYIFLVSNPCEVLIESWRKLSEGAPVRLNFKTPKGHCFIAQGAGGVTFSDSASTFSIPCVCISTPMKGILQHLEANGFAQGRDAKSI